MVDIKSNDPARAAGAKRQNIEESVTPGFTEEQTKDVELASGGGFTQTTSDPDGNQLRGEDQLVDGVVGEEQLADTQDSETDDE